MIGLVVKGQPDAGASRHFAGGIEPVRPQLPGVQRLARLRRQARHDQVLVPQLSRGVETLLPVRKNRFGRHVRGRSLQSFFLERVSHFLRAATEVLEAPQQLDIRIANRTDRGQRALGIGLHGFPYGVQLQPNAVEFQRAVSRRMEIRPPSRQQSGGRGTNQGKEMSSLHDSTLCPRSHRARGDGRESIFRQIRRQGNATPTALPPFGNAPERRRVPTRMFSESPRPTLGQGSSHFGVGHDRIPRPSRRARRWRSVYRTGHRLRAQRGPVSLRANQQCSVYLESAGDFAHRTFREAAGKHRTVDHDATGRHLIHKPQSRSKLVPAPIRHRSRRYQGVWQIAYLVGWTASGYARQSRALDHHWYAHRTHVGQSAHRGVEDARRAEGRHGVIPRLVANRHADRVHRQF